MKKFKGIIHVHSNYSYDGLHSLEEIARYGKDRGYRFIGMSEHSDTFTEKIMEKYVNECRKVSTPECLLISGIEFSCNDNLHLVGLGIERYIDTKDPLTAAGFIREQNGIAIIAHPSRYECQIAAALLSVVDGIEVWSAAYDGRFVPNDRSLALISQLRSGNGSLLAFGGQDLHKINMHLNVKITLASEALEKNAIIDALKQGNFTISNLFFQIDSRRKTGALKLTQIYLARRLYHLTKGFRNRLATRKKKK